MIKNRKTGENISMFLYEEAFLQVKKEIEKALVTSPLMIKEYLSHLTYSQGKYIRAVSVLTAAQNSDRMVPQDAVKAAAAIEIIHLASLVHDDIIDDADLRRGNITIQKKFGKRTAVICGDYLLALSLRLLSSVTDQEEYHKVQFPDYIGRLCLGELNQHINNNNMGLSIYAYLKIISGKTAALFEAAFLAGALTGGRSEEEMESYKKIGHCVGMIFQLMDDCLDFDTEVDEAKKPVQTDYENGVITLPLIHALQQDASFKTQADRGELSRNEINNAVQKADGLGFTKIIITRYYTKAMKHIELLRLDEIRKGDLVGILNKASRMK